MVVNEGKLGLHANLEKPLMLKHMYGPFCEFNTRLKT